MQLIKKILSITVIIACLFCIIAILDFTPTDPSYLNATNQPVKNITSIYGAKIADPIIQAFGYAMLMQLLIVIFLCIRILLSKSLKFLILKSSSLLLSLPLICFIIALFDDNTIADGDYYNFHFGGYVGYFIKTELMYSKNFNQYIGVISVILLLAFLFELCLIEQIFEIANNNHVKNFKLQIKKLLQKKHPSHNSYSENKSQIIDEYPDISFIKQQSHTNTSNAGHFDIVSNQSFNKLNIIENNQQSTNQLKTDIPRSVKHSTNKLIESTFILPTVEILRTKDSINRSNTIIDTEDQKMQLLRVLNEFGIKGVISEVFHGPVVTLYGLEPVPGTKSSRVIGLADDIARSMKVTSTRVAVIQGKNAIGIEIPNAERQTINFRDIIASTEYMNNEYQLPLALGKNIIGENVVVDLAKMPHLLVAGATGSGKSVAIHTMIVSLLYKYTPDECKFIMIDPKMLELSVYADIPHLLAPVVTMPDVAITTMQWVVKEMGTRYRAMSILGVRNITSYNKLIREAKNCNSMIEKSIQTGFNNDTKQPMFESIIVASEHLPYIVVIIDEMADLMLVAGKEIEMSVQRLAQMARAAGIHLIMSTQRPSVDVITGVIKANLPTRISLQVASKIDSRTILGENGAEQLLSAGDMLYMMNGGKIERLHGAYIDDHDIAAIVTYIKKQRNVEYLYSNSEENFT